MARVTAFDITAYDHIVGGIPIKDGLVSSTVTAEGPAFADELGADGHVQRYATHETRATLEIVLKGSSEENQKLSALHAADVASSSGVGVVPVLVFDNNGATKISTDSGWITQQPAKGVGSAAQDVTWNIRLVLNKPLEWVVGGN